MADLRDASLNSVYKAMDGTAVKYEVKGYFVDDASKGETASVLRVALRELAALRWIECRIHPDSFKNMSAALLRTECANKNNQVSDSLATIAVAMGALCGFGDKLRIVVSTRDTITWSMAEPDVKHGVVELHLHVSGDGDGGNKVYLLAFDVAGTNMTFRARSKPTRAAESAATVTCTKAMSDNIITALNAHATLFTDIAGCSVTASYTDTSSQLAITINPGSGTPTGDVAKCTSMVDTLVCTTLVGCDVTLTKIEGAEAPAHAYERPLIASALAYEA